MPILRGILPKLLPWGTKCNCNIGNDILPSLSSLSYRRFSSLPKCGYIARISSGQKRNQVLGRPCLMSSSTNTSSDNKEGENKIKSILQKSFPSASTVLVEDISGIHKTNQCFIKQMHECLLLVLGGCGSMYQVFIESKDFEGLSIVKQHQLVNKVQSQG